MWKQPIRVRVASLKSDSQRPMCFLCNDVNICLEPYRCCRLHAPVKAGSLKIKGAVNEMSSVVNHPKDTNHLVNHPRTILFYAFCTLPDEWFIIYWNWWRIDSLDIPCSPTYFMVVVMVVVVAALLVYFSHLGNIYWGTIFMLSIET